MELLEANQIKEKKTKREEEQFLRVQKLNQAETDSTKRLNAMLEKEKSEKRRVESELSQNQSRLKIKKTELSSEVDVLEKRKQEALKPIDEIRRESEESLKQNIEEKNRLDGLDKEIKKKSENIVERVEMLDERSESLSERAEIIMRRESAITSEEGFIKKSLENLSEKWSEYRTKIYSSNANLDRRSKEVGLKEKEVGDRSKANEAIQEELGSKKVRLHREDLQVQAKYRALGKAIEEFNKKKNGGS